MKKVLLFASMAAVMASCSDDDSNNTSTGLSGTWKVTSFTSATPIDINGDGTASPDLMAETGCYNNMKFVFSGSNSVVLNAQEADFDLDSGEMTCVTVPAQNGTYAQDGNNVTVTIDGEAFTLVKSGNTLTGTDDTDFGTVTMVVTKQ